MKELYTVQEFAQLTGIEASTLRYWADIGIFRPAKRDEENNYRYFSPEQIFELNFVSVLSELNVPLKTIAELERERGPEELLSLLERQERLLDMEMRNLRLRYSILHTRRELLNVGLRSDETEITVDRREDRPLIFWSPNEYEEGDTFITPLVSFMRHAKERFINLCFPIGGWFSDLESFVKNPARPERFFSIDPVGHHARREGDYLIGFTRGDYYEFGDLPERMAAYARENSVNAAGPVYIMYLQDEVCIRDRTRYLAQVCVEIPKRK